MREKILYGERVPNPNSPGGLSNELRGAHSPKIKSRADFVVNVICNNPDGTTTVKLIKLFPDGNVSRKKKSTLAPDTWSDDKIMDTTDQVASTPPIAIRLSDRATLHQQTVDGVDWVVIKDALNNVISSYPTGGNPTNL
jgi:hypothetical protein